MYPVVKKSEVQKIFPKRDVDSHKGQNGRVLVVGGSLDYFGAPLLSSMGALSSGADLATLLVPECNFEVSRSFYPDFIVRKYPGNFVNSRMYDQAMELATKADAILIGPGISEDQESLRVITKIVERATCDVILDAEAIPASAQLGLISGGSAHLACSSITITPHRGEMEQISPHPLPTEIEEQAKLVEDFANKWGVTILLKTPRDIISSPDKPTTINHTGNAGMTVGGSGDVLAGLVTSLISQHAHPYDACVSGAFLLGTAGDTLFKQKGYNFTATDLALELAYTIHNILD